MPMLARDHHI